MAKKAGQQGLIFRKSDNAVADVAGRQHVEFFAQSSAGTAVIADGDDRAELIDEPFLWWWTAVRVSDWTGHILLQSLEQSREAGPPADGNHTQASTGSRLVPAGEYRVLLGMSHVGPGLDFLVETLRGSRRIRPRIRIEKFGETGILGQVLKVGIIARLEAQCRIQTD